MRIKHKRIIVCILAISLTFLGYYLHQLINIYNEQSTDSNDEIGLTNTNNETNGSNENSDANEQINDDLNSVSEYDLISEDEKLSPENDTFYPGIEILYENTENETPNAPLE